MEYDSGRYKNKYAGESTISDEDILMEIKTEPEALSSNGEHPANMGIVQKPKRKRMGWSEASEIALLDLWPERIEELRGQRKNGHVYAEMSDDLSRLGYICSPRDVQVKLQNFTQRYRKEKAAMRISGASPSTWIHYARIHKIIGGFIKLSEPNFFNEMGLESTDVTTNTTDDSNLDELLESFNLIEVKPFLTRAEITFESLKYLSKEDIKEAIPPIGLRACFREKLFSWRKTEYSADDETLSESIANKVVYWLQNPSNIGTTSTPTSTFSTSAGISKLSKSLKLILEESLKGKSIAAYYEKNSHLTDSLRADLINIILEDIFYHDAKLSPKDFPIIVEEIVENFCNEIREYYFIPRGKKANPGGKLWDKYVNQRAKRARLDKFYKDDLEPADSTVINSEIDETILLELKSSLTRDISDWDNIRDVWGKTFLIRQKELKTIKNIFEFMSNWELYSNRRFDELINIDFQLMHPNKSNLLFTKWNEFKQKIGSYYYLHIKDKKSKEILTYSKDVTNQDSLDYIHIILLNAVILPTARFYDKVGKILKKITIPDANDSFIIHLTAINDYENVICKVREQYYSNDLTVQPFIIVVGPSIYNLEDFYVYFDKTLLKCDCFLKSLDVCFKVIQTLFLEYPKGCQGPWLFIQEYFYEIKPANDCKLSNIYSLLNFLKFQ